MTIRFSGQRLLLATAFFGLLLHTILIPLAAQQNEDPVIVTHEQQADNSYLFTASNSSIIPMWLRINFLELKNTTLSVRSPFEIVLPPKTERLELFTATPNLNLENKFRYEYVFQRGNPKSKHDDSYLYLLPFAHGTKVHVGQGFNGSFTHFGQNLYAIDFDMEVGSPVFAARGGVVVDVKEDSNVGGADSRYNDDSNYVFIYHSDGSFGNYVHLQLNGALVNVGDTVEAGQLIGYSGNTGFSSGPHLHFDVRLPGPNGREQTIPIRFRNVDGSAFVPKTGQFVYASHPGKEAFSIVLGSELKPVEFENWLATVPINNTVQIRQQLIDKTYVLYIQNGVDRAIEGEVTLTLTNMVSMKGNPVRLKIPPRSEVFLTILQPVDPTKTIGFGASSRFY